MKHLMLTAVRKLLDNFRQMLELFEDLEPTPGHQRDPRSLLRVFTPVVSRYSRVHSWRNEIMTTR